MMTDKLNKILLLAVSLFVAVYALAPVRAAELERQARPALIQSQSMATAEADNASGSDSSGSASDQQAAVPLEPTQPSSSPQPATPLEPSSSDSASASQSASPIQPTNPASASRPATSSPIQPGASSGRSQSAGSKSSTAVPLKPENDSQSDSSGEKTDNPASSSAKISAKKGNTILPATGTASGLISTVIGLLLLFSLVGFQKFSKN